MTSTETKPHLPPNLHLTAEDYKLIQQYYDEDKNGTLDDKEIQHLIADYNNKKIENPKVVAILHKYDMNNDGFIDVDEFETIQNAFEHHHAQLRIAAFAPLGAKIFRYLAFTSDFGEALRPVIPKAIVTGSYLVAFGYCAADIAFEAHKLKKNNYVNDHGEKITMAHGLAERTTFQAIASLAGPAFIIHQSVHLSKRLFQKIGRFAKWGPSIVGLSVIPFLPIVLDEPVEHGVHLFYRDYVFNNKSSNNNDKKEH